MAQLPGYETRTQEGEITDEATVRPRVLSHDCDLFCGSASPLDDLHDAISASPWLRIPNSQYKHQAIVIKSIVVIKRDERGRGRDVARSPWSTRPRSIHAIKITRWSDPRLSTWHGRAWRPRTSEAIRNRDPGIRLKKASIISPTEVWDFLFCLFLSNLYYR